MTIKLDYILHVPNLSCNLLSINQLMKTSNCSAKFLPSHCVFQDLLSGKAIGSAKEYEGIYYFDKASVSEQGQTTTCDSASVSRDSEILL